MESARTEALAESQIDFGAPCNFDVAIVAKAKHADLWRAAKKLGGQAALARHLGVQQSVLGDWCNLKAMPRFDVYESVDGRIVRPRFSDPEMRLDIERKLYALTGKTVDELFPPELRNNQDFFKQAKTQEFYTTVDLKKLAHCAPDRFLLPCPVEQATIGERNAKLHEAIKSLSDRQRRIIEMRFGLNGEDAKTLEQVGDVLNISRERVRQIEAKAIRILQSDFALCVEDMAP